MTRPALLVLLTACGSTSYIPPQDGGTDGGTNACADRTGTYVSHFVERAGGKCGAISDTVIDTSNNSSTCQGTSTPSSDNCSVDINETCDASGQTFEETGTSHWSHDGATGTAIVTITRLDASGGAQCVSTYDVTFTKT